MLSKYVMPGDRLEVELVQRKNPAEEAAKKVYVSKVYEILSEERLEMMMPMEKTKLILLPVDEELDVCFYTKQGLFQCFARIIDRYKRENVYIVLLELKSNLRKHQRREYYRFSCVLEMDTRNLEEEEVMAIEKRQNLLLPGIPLKRSVIVDISGGGLRFVANQVYDVGSFIYCKYELFLDGKAKQYDLVGKVLYLKEMENRPGDYEHRVQYVNINTVEREEIIRYIFEEERKNRRKGS